jgi:hypothetical protein
VHHAAGMACLHLADAPLCPSYCSAAEKVCRNWFMTPTGMLATRWLLPEEWRSAGGLMLLLSTLEAASADTSLCQCVHAE